MAITSIGYDGSVNEAQWAKLVPLAGSAHYGVAGANDWKVTAHATLDRGISIAAGSGWGHGVLDTSSTTVSLQGATVSSGSRWDLVVARRNWSGTGGATTFVLIGGSSSKTLPTRNEGPGTLDDQPVALVQFSQGSTAATAIVDLRCWSRNGGMTARDDLALTYLKEAGAQVVVNGKTWICSVATNGQPAWTTDHVVGRVPLFGVGSVLVGGSGSGVSQFLMQAGTTVGKTDGAGYARLTFPTPFPGGLVTVITTNGDASIDRSRGQSYTFPVAGAPWDNGRLQDFVYNMQHTDGRNAANATHRVNWIAIGW